MLLRTTMTFLLGMLLCSGGHAAAQEAPEKPSDATPTQQADPNIYSSGAFQEVYIDEDYRLYEQRKYQGIVPGKPDEEGIAPTDVPAPSGKTHIDRVGFEQRELFSRVFVMADQTISPWVYDNFVQAQANPEIPYQIFVEFADAAVPRRNDERPLITRAFNTPVDSIATVKTKGGLRVVITLKREARYLPVQVGKVLYIDVER